MDQNNDEQAKIQETIPLLTAKQNKTPEDVLPLPTEWKPLCCKSSPFWQVVGKPEIYFNFIRIRFFPYYLINLLYISLFWWWWKNVAPILVGNWNCLKYIFSIPWVFCIYSYGVVHFKNPGILPFSWSHTKKKNYTTKELRDGKSTRDDQKEYAKAHDIPERAWFSSTTGYFILRGDHECKYLQTWVGLRNHRFFILGLFWGTISISVWCCSAFYVIYHHLQVSSWKITAPMFLMSLPLMIQNCSMTFFQSMLTTKNQTTIERILKTTGHYFHGGSCEGWVEICGPMKWIPCWIFPFPIPPSTDGFSFYKNPNIIDELGFTSRPLL